MGNRAPKKPPKAAAPKRAASKATPAAVDAETRHPQASATYRDEVGAMLADPARFDEGVEYLYRLAVESDVGKPGQIGQATFAQPGLSALSMLPEAERMRYLDAVLGMMPDRLPASVIARLPLADKLRGLPEGVRHGFAPELQVDRAPGPTPDMEGQLLPRPPARMSKKQREAELRRVAAEGRQAAGLVEVAVGPATRAKPPPASAKYGVPYLIEDDTARRAARAAFPVQPGAEIVVVSAPEGGLPSGWDERDARRGWKSITYHGVKGDDTSAPRSVMQVLDSRGDGDLLQLASGIVWAVDQGADVINLSLGATTDSGAVRQALEYARQKGVMVAAAAGNSGESLLYPAALLSQTGRGVAVGSLNAQRTVSSFSSTADSAMLFAPGEDVYSLYPGNRAAQWSGTSLSAPVVSGELAYLSAQGLTPEEAYARAAALGTDVAGGMSTWKAVDFADLE